MVKVDAFTSAFYDNTLVVYILAASVIELIAAGINCDELDSCETYDGWAVAVGAVSTGFTLIHFLLAVFAPKAADKIAPALSVFLALWWIPGAFVPTFKRPFEIPGNGYYACWIAFFASMMFFQRNALALFSGHKDSLNEDQPASHTQMTSQA